MTKLAYALLFTTATIATPALAATAVSPIAFERGGVHYVATVTDREDGSRVIAGREIESGHTFNLTVAKGAVNGVYDNQFVSYDAPRGLPAKPAATGVAIASNTGM